MIGVAALIAGSSEITEADLKAIWTDEVAQELENNPLNRTFEVLGSILVHLGEEAIQRAADNAKEERAARAALRYESVAVGREGTRPLHPSTPQKRNVSDTSFGGRSPNTTPKKLKKPETYIQN